MSSIFLFSGTVFAQQYILSTLAGGAPPPTPAMATAEAIYPPSAIAVNSSGDIYISSASTILRIDTAGVLTRVAGNSRRSFSGDGGPAANATVADPSGLAFDPAGNLYTAETLNSRVRRISPEGVIATVAGNGIAAQSGDGGPASSAALWWPVSVGADDSGNLFIADQIDGLIRKVSPNGVITLIYRAGSANAVTGNAPGITIAADHSGSLFVTDGNHNVVRKVSPGGEAVIVAGTGTSGFGGDGGPATAALLSGPSGAVVDADGNLYFIDTGNRRVRKVSSGDGTITTIAGGGTVFAANGVPATQADLYIPTALAIDQGGALYLAAGWVQKIAPDGTITIVGGDGFYTDSGDGGPATSAQLFQPSDVELDAGGNLIIVESGSQMIRRVDRAGIITTIAGNGNCGFSGDGGPASKASFCYPSGAAIDGAGNIFVSDSENGRIRKIAPSGVITTVAGTGARGYSGDGGPATKAALNYPFGMAFDPAGNLVFADYQNHRIRKISSTGIITTIAGTGEPGFSGDGGPATSAQLFIPRSVAVDSSGTVFVADSGNDRIRKITPDGTISTLASQASVVVSADGTPATNGAAFSAYGIAVDRAGNVYTTTPFGRIFRTAPDGTVMTIAGNGPMFAVAEDGVPALTASLGAVDGLRVDASGRLYVVAGGLVRVLQPVNQSVLIGAVVDAASQRAVPVSPGKLIVIYGTGLGPTQLVSGHPVNGVYPAQVSEMTVTINGLAAPVLYTSFAQVGAIVPYGVTGSVAQVVVTYRGNVSDGVSVPVAAVQPSLFSANGTGGGQAAAVNGNGSINDAAHPAAAGGVLSLYATGEGRTTPGGLDGQLAPVAAPFPQPQLPVRVTVDGQPAEVLYAGDAPGEVEGLMQVVIRVPAGVHAGGYVPIALQVGDAATVPGALWIAVAGGH